MDRKGLYHQSFYPGATSDAASASGNIDFITKSVKASFVQSWICSDYIAEVGYIRRTGFFKTSTGLKYSTYPGKGEILYHGPNIDFDIIFDPEIRMSDRQTQIGYSVNWKSRSILAFNLTEDYVKLSSPFDPTNSGGIKFISGSEFTG
jgi:hypothetical protein